MPTPMGVGMAPTNVAVVQSMSLAALGPPYVKGLVGYWISTHLVTFTPVKPPDARV